MALPKTNGNLTYDDAISALISEIKNLNEADYLNKEYYRGQFELLCYVLPGDMTLDEIAPDVAQELGLPDITSRDF